MLVISAVLSAGIIKASKDASWWTAWQAGTLVAVLAVLGSLAVIRQAIGKPVSVMPAVTMLLSGVRLGISLTGLIVAVKAYKMPPEPTAVMICGYYAVVLIVESFVMHRALRQMTPSNNVGAAVEGPEVMTSLLAAANPLSHVVDHRLYATHGGLWILSNHIVMLLLTAVITSSGKPQVDYCSRDLATAARCCDCNVL